MRSGSNTQRPLCTTWAKENTISRNSNDHKNVYYGQWRKPRFRNKLIGWIAESICVQVITRQANEAKPQGSLWWSFESSGLQQFTTQRKGSSISETGFISYDSSRIGMDNVVIGVARRQDGVTTDQFEHTEVRGRLDQYGRSFHCVLKLEPTEGSSFVFAVSR